MHFQKVYSKEDAIKLVDTAYNKAEVMYTGYEAECEEELSLLSHSEKIKQIQKWKDALYIHHKTAHTFLVQNREKLLSQVSGSINIEGLILPIKFAPGLNNYQKFDILLWQMIIETKKIKFLAAKLTELEDYKTVKADPDHKSTKRPPEYLRWIGKNEQLDELYTHLVKKHDMFPKGFIKCDVRLFNKVMTDPKANVAIVWLAEQIHLLWFLQECEFELLIAKPQPFYKGVIKAFKPEGGVYKETNLKDSNSRLNGITNTDKEPYTSISKIVKSLTIPKK